jgi:hypothetical protein
LRDCRPEGCFLVDALVSLTLLKLPGLEERAFGLREDVPSLLDSSRDVLSSPWSAIFLPSSFVSLPPATAILGSSGASDLRSCRPEDGLLGDKLVLPTLFKLPGLDERAFALSKLPGLDERAFALSKLPGLEERAFGLRDHVPSSLDSSLGVWSSSESAFFLSPSFASFPPSLVVVSSIGASKLRSSRPE